MRLFPVSNNSSVGDLSIKEILNSKGLIILKTAVQHRRTEKNGPKNAAAVLFFFP